MPDVEHVPVRADRQPRRSPGASTSACGVSRPVSVSIVKAAILFSSCRQTYKEYGIFSSPWGSCRRRLLPYFTTIGAELYKEFGEFLWGSLANRMGVNCSRRLPRRTIALRPHNAVFSLSGEPKRSRFAAAALIASDLCLPMARVSRIQLPPPVSLAVEEFSRELCEITHIRGRPSCKTQL